MFERRRFFKTLGTLGIAAGAYSTYGAGISEAAEKTSRKRDENVKHADTEWFVKAKCGAFTHYLTGADTSSDDWNRRVDSFDTEALAESLIFAGTNYYFITIGQNSGHYCAPNQTYDTLAGIKPSKCSKRDLISDLYDVLSPRGIKLLVYLPSGAPAADLIAMKALKWEWGFKGNWPSWDTGRTGKRLAEFQLMWEDVVREWSMSWGEKICGWWIDGCYFADEMYRHGDAPNFKSFAEALKAGNSDSIVAFNPGVKVPVISHTEYEDYTAGEISDSFPVCPGRYIDGDQYHILSYLGETWGGGQPRFSDEFVIGFTKDTCKKGGVVTWDMHISYEGKIPPEFLRQFKRINYATTFEM